MFAIAQTAFGWRCFMRHTHRLEAGYPVVIMNISPIAAASPSTSNVRVMPQILGAIIVALALTGSALLMTSLLFDFSRAPRTAVTHHNVRSLLTDFTAWGA